MIETMREMRSAVRRLARSPGFTLVSILTLALGIGANSAMFSVVNAVLLEPLPYANQERLVRIWGSSAEFPKSNVNPLDALDWRSELESFDALALFHAGEVTFRNGDEALRIPNARITHGYFELLGVSPIYGTTFGEESEVEGSDDKVILSYGFWQSAFSGERNAVGRTIALGEREYQVIGIMPKGYRDPMGTYVGDPMLWRPMVIDRERQGRGGHFMQVFARLAPGVDLAAAQAETDALTRQFEKIYPNTNTGYGALIEPLRSTIVGDSRGVLILLMSAVAVVLLIACVNVANLMLARGAARGRELAIRTSLGASRFALARLMLMDALLLGAGGAIVAVAVCASMMKALGAIVERSLLVRNPIELDGRVIGFTILLSVVAALVCSLVPAAQASGARAFSGLRETGRSGGVGRSGRAAMRTLVVSQIALSAVVLVAAGLLVRSLQRLTAVDPGVDVARVVAVDLRLSPSAYPEDAQIFAFHDGLRERLTRRSEIVDAAITNILPFAKNHSCDGYVIEGRVELPGAGPCAETRSVSQTYFSTMGIPIIAGRGLDATDENIEAPGIVISQSMVPEFDGNPIGQRVQIGVDGEPWATVVGVVGDVRHFGLAEAPPPMLYVPFVVSPYYGVELVVRAREDAATVIPSVRSEIRDLDRAIPLNRVETLEAFVSRSLGSTRLRTALLTGFGILALVLAASGIYGVFSFLVASARRDTGVRMALGADRGRILGGVLRDVTTLAAVGILVGLLASVGTGRLLEAFLHGVSSLDIVTLVSVAGCLFVISLMACWLPARRAMSVNPMEALREE